MLGVRAILGLGLGLLALPVFGQGQGPLPSPGLDGGIVSGRVAEQSDAGMVAPPPTTPTTVSSNDAFAIRFEQLAPKQCRVVGLRETKEIWQLKRCLATTDDVFFISDTGDRFWVLRTLPKKPPEGKGKNPRWWGTVVAEEFDKSGERVRHRRLSDLIEPYDRSKVQQLGRHFKWLEGVVGLKGRSPRVNDLNQVEFEVVGGKKVTLTF